MSQTCDECNREGTPGLEDGVETRCRFSAGRHEDEGVLIRTRPLAGEGSWNMTGQRGCPRGLSGMT